MKLDDDLLEFAFDGDLEAESECFGSSKELPFGSVRIGDPSDYLVDLLEDLELSFSMQAVQKLLEQSADPNAKACRPP